MNVCFSRRNLLLVAGVVPWLLFSFGCASGPDRLLSDGEVAQLQPLLNSERIERRFGNYAIEVIAQDRIARVSDLYSQHGEVRTTRTLAFVEWVLPIDHAIVDLHERILAGGSLGATFKAAGWRVEKGSFTFIEAFPRTESPHGLCERMRIARDGPPLAGVGYHLMISRDGLTLPYAEITEIYHPDFLRREDLKALFNFPVNL